MATSRMGEVGGRISERSLFFTHKMEEEGGAIRVHSPSSPRGMTGAPRSRVPMTSYCTPGPERIWMLLAMTRLPSMKSLLSQTANRSGGAMAAQSPSMRETKRISPETALPIC